MKCVRGEKLMLLAATFAAELSCGTEANEILAFSDFFGMVTANLIAIANRKLYILSPDSDCLLKSGQKPTDGTTNPNG